jgi:EmrB/QacA subfamily drug resistance transporter
MTATTSNGVGLRSERGPVLFAIMLCTGLVAIDSTIIATAVPSIVADLGGFSQFPWLFSIYLLTQAMSVPIYGRLCDMYGRRPVMYAGVALFLLGSVLCGVAWNMSALIASRAVQGLGAGAILPVSTTVVGDMYSVEERARVQGYLGSVWGISAVIGPALGGLFSEYLTWRWIFFINVPLGAFAVWMLARHFTERVDRTSHRIDYAGAALLTAGSSLIMLGLLQGGVAWGWTDPPSLIIFAAGLACVAAFVLVERRAAEPILPLWVFRHRVLVGGNLVSLAVGAVLIGVTSYIPTYAEGVLGTSALAGGFALAALSIGWPLASGVSGRIYLRIGFRDTTLIGAFLMLAGVVLCTLLAEHSPIWEVAAMCFVVGAGLGLSSAPAMVAIQSVVEWERRGVVTAANMFCRSLGSAAGAAVLGAISNSTLSGRFEHPPAALAGRLPGDVDEASRVLQAQGGATASPIVSFIRTSLFQATHHVFLTLIVMAAVCVAAVLLMPRRTKPIAAD